MILEQLTGLAFGHVTISVVVLLLAGLLLSGVYQLGLSLVKLALAVADENAPEYDWKNLVWDKFKVVTKQLYIPDIVFEQNKYILTTGISGQGYLQCGTYSSDNSNPTSCHRHQTKQEAIDAFNKHGRGGTVNFKLLGGILAIDLAIVLLQLWFMPSLVLLAVVGVVFSVRLIAKMLYKNMKKTNDHEERIGTLETKL